MKAAVLSREKAQSWAGETRHQGARTEGQPSPQGPRSTSPGSYELGNTDTEMLCLVRGSEIQTMTERQQLRKVPSRKSEQRPSVIDSNSHFGHKFNKLGFIVSQVQEFSSSKWEVWGKWERGITRQEIDTLNSVARPG